MPEYAIAHCPMQCVSVAGLHTFPNEQCFGRGFSHCTKKPSRIRGGFGSVENGKAMRYLAASPSWS